MDAAKEKLLWDTYKKIMDVSFGNQLPLSLLDELMIEDVMGFGTTVDEKIFAIAGMRELTQRQREQSKGLQMELNYTPLFHHIAPDGNSAVIADDILLSITINNETIEMYVRFSTVFEFRQNKWLMVHFHGSKPENVESEKDTFGIEDWKRKNAELEKIVAERTAELKQSLENLKATQQQLIHSEKMASLGELTAGIAHEIQNPLNFVNNFSEINTELIEEMKKEIAYDHKHEAIALADDLEQNLRKITHHGKRADAIVKNMLQHSRASTGQKEPTDINALVDECLRLSYHGLRAKDKSFNAKLQTKLNLSLEKVNVVPQDITRVLINLFSNAFYSVAEKKKQLNGTSPAGQGGLTAGEAVFEPTIVVSTTQSDSKVQVVILDNGLGIPQHVLDKIYQPFFTTKPPGEGTGLGLSLSYGIIKAHGGEMKVETKEGEGAEFIIQLPQK